MFPFIVVMWYATHALGSTSSLNYPSRGVTVFSTSTVSTCHPVSGEPYRGRIYRYLSPRLDTCYKCSGKAIKWEKLRSEPGGIIRQCVNLNNDCGGAFTCTDIQSGTCVTHPCISGSAVYGEWFNLIRRGYLVQPYGDASCGSSASLSPSYFYVDMVGRCLVFDNTTLEVPNNPKCTKWTSEGTSDSVTVCQASERTCNNTSPAIDPTACTLAGGALCATHQVDTLADSGTCGDGTGWPFLNAPGAKVQFVDGPPLFAGASTVTFGMELLVVALCAIMTFF